MAAQPNIFSGVATAEQDSTKLSHFADRIFVLLGVPYLHQKLSWSWESISNRGGKLGTEMGVLSEAFSVGTYRVTVGMNAAKVPEKYKDKSTVIISATNNNEDDPIRGVVLISKKNDNPVNQDPREVVFRYKNENFDGLVRVKAMGKSHEYQIGFKDLGQEEATDVPLAQVLAKLGTSSLAAMMKVLVENPKDPDDLVLLVCSLLSESELRQD